MDLTSYHERRTGDVTTSRHTRCRFQKLNNAHATEVDTEGHRMTLTQKIMLCGQFVGMEATMNFEHVYSVPILQTLGMPLSLAFIFGLVSGPSSILIIPPLGWLIDMERHSHRRKFASLVFAAALEVVGMLCLLAGNALHLRCLLDYNGTTNNSSMSGGTPNGSDSADLFRDVAVNMSVENVNWQDPNWTVDFFLNSSGMEQKAQTLSAGCIGGSASVPFKAGLALFGFILLDIGFDCCNGFVKAFIVTCSLRSEQTSLIMLGVIVGSLGGVTNAVLGVVDFTSLLGLNFVEGAKLNIQTSVQGLITTVIVITGLLFTAFTGRKLLNERKTNKLGTSPGTFCESRESATSTQFHRRRSYQHQCDPEPHIAQRRNSVEEVTTEIGTHPLGGSNTHRHHSLPFVEENPPPMAEDVPLLEEDHGHGEENGDHVMAGYGSTESTVPRRLGESSVVETCVEGAGKLRSERAERGWLVCLRNPKMRVALVCVTTLFSAGSINIYTLALSDFVGKGVYGGDPEAEPGSESLSSFQYMRRACVCSTFVLDLIADRSVAFAFKLIERYQEGIQMASWALLVHYITYLIFSIAHPTIVALLGFRLEFILLQLVFSVLQLVTGLTSRLEAVFMLSVVTGIYRTCFYTMPYTVTNDIAQTMNYASGGRSPVSLAMSLVATSVPLGYCLLFTWVGAVEELTGDVSTPLWLGSAYGILSITTFLFVGKV